MVPIPKVATPLPQEQFYLGTVNCNSGLEDWCFFSWCESNSRAKTSDL